MTGKFKLIMLLLVLLCASTEVQAQNPNNTQQVQQQQYPEQYTIHPVTGERLDNLPKEIRKIKGKIIEIGGEEGLNVPNLAFFKTDDGYTLHISHPSRKFKINEKLTLEGYSKNTYYDGIMKTENVFYVTKILN